MGDLFAASNFAIWFDVNQEKRTLKLHQCPARLATVVQPELLRCHDDYMQYPAKHKANTKKIMPYARITLNFLNSLQTSNLSER
eukprot:UN15249